MKKRYLLPLLLIAAYALGPQKNYEAVDGKIQAISVPLSNLDQYIQAKEASVPNIKPDNESRIIWADSLRKTPYSVVYLHGFSASWFEGNGIHELFAKRYGCNLYLPRLSQHGIADKDAFGNLTPEDYLNSAKEAIAIGRSIGEKVIVMSCSTGSTLSVYLEAENPDCIDAQIMYSPNIDLGFPASDLLTMPWGEQIINSLLGEYRDISVYHSEEDMAYISDVYKSEGVVALKDLINQTMTPAIFQKITKPYFLGYYYKNDEEKDNVVSIPDLLAFDQQTTTPTNQKRLVAFPEVGTHVIPNLVLSKDIESVRAETFKFAEEVLGLQVKDKFIEGSKVVDIF